MLTETTKVLNKDGADQNLPDLETTEAEVVYSKIINNNYEEDSRIL